MVLGREGLDTCRRAENFAWFSTASRSLMEVDVVVTGARQTQELIDRLSHRLDDETPALRGLVDTLLEVHQERFHGRGVRWRPLDPETRRIDAQQGRDRRPNVNTG